MTSFKEKLNDLFNSQFGKREKEDNFYNITNSNYLNTTPNKVNLSSSRSNSFYSNRNISNQRSNSFKNKINSKNSYSPIFTERKSSNNIFNPRINDYLMKFRENSGKKFKIKIKKEIDYLSNSFGNNLISYKNPKINNQKKSNFDNFNISYTTTVSSLKNYNRNKKNDLRYHILPKNSGNEDEISILYRQIKEKRNNRISNF